MGYFLFFETLFSFEPCQVLISTVLSIPFYNISEVQIQQYDPYGKMQYDSFVKQD